LLIPLKRKDKLNFFKRQTFSFACANIKKININFKINFKIYFQNNFFLILFRKMTFCKLIYNVIELKQVGYGKVVIGHFFPYGRAISLIINII